jgi:acetolactate synthase-1/2/3 large subunit
MSNSDTASAKYAEVVMGWLNDLGYTHCFCVAGGNIMHLLDGARKTMTCIPTVHEVAAGIAVEYFNESQGEGRAFALVTAGPGLTNIVTAIGGAWLESRELLVIGGQAKSTDLAGPTLRQRGIQEIDGISIVDSISTTTGLVERPWTRREFTDAVLSGQRGRPGPVFLEFCLDAQGTPVDPDELDEQPIDLTVGPGPDLVAAAEAHSDQIHDLLASAKRPVWLLGARVTRPIAEKLRPRLDQLGIPIMTTWNGADRIAADAPMFFGRPNTWGQRHANVLLAQADLIVAFGARLGLQQTGFNWQEFGHSGRVIQIDTDRAEIEKGHPTIHLGIEGDPDAALLALAGRGYPDYQEWVDFCREVTEALPSPDPANTTGEGFVSPYQFCVDLSDISRDDDVLIVASSGGANSVPMQTLRQRHGQVIVTGNGLASMGYCLSGAIGASVGHPGRRTVMIEGDGGFSQNLQELSTVVINDLNLKIFLFCNEGYGSIRMVQKNYFDGEYIGCDTLTGLGFPDWEKLFAAYDIRTCQIGSEWTSDPEVLELFDGRGPAAFIVPVDPLQTYWPKITSRVTESGGMESNPLYQMTPNLPEDLAARVLRHLA